MFPRSSLLGRFGGIRACPLTPGIVPPPSACSPDQHPSPPITREKLSHIPAFVPDQLPALVSRSTQKIWCGRTGSLRATEGVAVCTSVSLADLRKEEVIGDMHREQRTKYNERRKNNCKAINPTTSARGDSIPITHSARAKLQRCKMSGEGTPRGERATHANRVIGGSLTG
ncbi:unnamed protein product, partial [Ectocarpus sp. 13 AM-2016]